MKQNYTSEQIALLRVYYVRDMIYSVAGFIASTIVSACLDLEQSIEDRRNNSVF